MSDLEKKIAELEERIKYLEAITLSQNFLNAQFLKFNAGMTTRRFVEAPPGCKVRLYQIPVGQKDPETGEEFPMEFLFPDGVKSLMTINVFVAEPPQEKKENP